jgi:hypothetical protein
VFQILTIENWGDIMNAMIRSSVGPWVSMIYLVSWIFIGNFSLLNLFLAILLDGFTGDELEEEEEDDDKKKV